MGTTWQHFTYKESLPWASPLWQSPFFPPTGLTCPSPVSLPPWAGLCTPAGRQWSPLLHYPGCCTLLLHKHCLECPTLLAPAPAPVKLQVQTQLQRTSTEEIEGDTLLGRGLSHLGTALPAVIHTAALRSNSMSRGMGTLLSTPLFSHRQQEKKQPQKDLCGLHRKPHLWWIISKSLPFCCTQGRSYRCKEQELVNIICRRGR